MDNIKKITLAFIKWVNTTTISSNNSEECSPKTIEELFDYFIENVWKKQNSIVYYE
jgi:hypothetical protein